jgi:segregation and condensation protein B
MTDESGAGNDSFGLDAFQDGLPDDQGLSLDELTRAYAELIGKGEDPYSEAPEVDRIGPERDAGPSEDPDGATGEPAAGEAEGEQLVEVSPRTILEAMLFVGHPENEPLTSETVAGYMRGVRPQEIDALVVQLNQSYDEQACPYRIESVGTGYRMVLREEFHALRDRFYGRVKAAKLSQAAIDVLSIVAYRQPLTREQVDDLRGRNSGSLLTQLVRRGLLCMERPDDKPRNPGYYTTDRLLELFGLESIRDLPQSPD